MVECSALNRISMQTLPSRLWEYQGNEQKEFKSCRMGSYWEMLRSGHYRAFSPMNPQQLWLVTGDQTSEISSMVWGGAREGLPLAEGLLVVHGGLQRKNHFSLRM